MPARTTPPIPDSLRLLCLAVCAAAALFATLTLLPACADCNATPPNPAAAAADAPAIHPLPASTS